MMSNVFVKRDPRESVFILALLALCLILFFFRLGARPLWDVDEGMHASTSKDMVLSGDWITPTFNGENFYDKPILHNWFVAISFLVFGFTEFAARLPAAILGLGGVLLTFLLGRKMFGPWVGFLAGVILATNAEYIMLSRSVVHDISLVFFTTSALICFYQGFMNERHRKIFSLLFYASLGFAVLAKGPVGVLLPSLIIGLFLLLKKKLGFLMKMHLGWGILIFLAVAAPWYVLISLRNADYGGYFFIKNNVMRFLSSRALHHAPFYYYIPALFGGFFPWSCLVPLVFIQAFREGIKKTDDRHLFLLLWVLVTFVFFSAASSKLATYILPLFPALSLLVGSLWNDFIEAPTPELRKGFLYSFLPVLVILPLGLIYLWIGPPLRFEVRHGIHLTRHSYIIVWIAVGIALSLWLLLRGHLKGSFFALAGTFASAVLIIELTILPLLNPYFTTQGLGLKLDRMVPRGEKFVFYDDVKDSTLFYTGRRGIVLKTPKEMLDFLDSEKKVFCIIPKKDYQRLDEFEKISNRSHIVEEEGGKLIISNNIRQ
jgi:4-amino-4-deoxy-L-arabinose transferase-like glycosyltransferase